MAESLSVKVQQLEEEKAKLDHVDTETTEEEDIQNEEIKYEEPVELEEIKREYAESSVQTKIVEFADASTDYEKVQTREMEIQTKSATFRDVSTECIKPNSEAVSTQTDEEAKVLTRHCEI